MFNNPTQFQPIRIQKRPYIILTTLSDFDRVDVPFMNRSILTRNKFMTYDVVLDHFNQNLKIIDSTMMYKDVPFHFFYEKIRDEFVIHKGAPLQNKQIFLKELVQSKIIDIKYQESIVIVLADEFQVYPPLKGFLDTIAYRLLTELTVLFDIPKEYIVMLNDIVDWEVYEANQKETDLTKRIQWKINNQSTMFLNYIDIMTAYGRYNNKR